MRKIMTFSIILASMEITSPYHRSDCSRRKAPAIYSFSKMADKMRKIKEVTVEIQQVTIEKLEH
jgi:hypothetical protein